MLTVNTIKLRKNFLECLKLGFQQNTELEKTFLNI